MIMIFVSQFALSQQSKISLSLFQLFPRVPRWNVEYTYQFTERYGFGLQIGYGNHSISPMKFKALDTRLPFEKAYSLFEIRPELYYKIGLKMKKMRFFASAEFFYIKHSDKFSNYWFEKPNETTTHYTSAIYKRTKKGINTNITFEIDITPRFFAQIKSGIGLRMRNVAFSEVIRTDTPPTTEGTILLPQYLTQEGNHLGINLNFDARIGYRF